MPDNIKAPWVRFHRLRRNPQLRDLVREHKLHSDDLILPLFVEEHCDQPKPIASMPGVFRLPETHLAHEVQRLYRKGIKAIILFGVSHHKDGAGSDTCHDQGLVSRMIRIAKNAEPNMLVICDCCFCEYTDHGHCGVLKEGQLDNDSTLVNLATQAVIAAQAGADMIAPSGMLDGMVTSIRAGLDKAGFTQVPIMSYSTKFASAFYGPFRDAAGSELEGDRRAYQMDAANAREALAESLTDLDEGADILMVKPALCYLDVVAKIRERSLRPLAVYHVSGEYAMLKLAAREGILDEQAVVMETMTAFKRAGADLIITYYAEQILDWL